MHPPKVMKNGFCSATTFRGSTALPFVISTEAQRSGEICGSAVPSWKLMKMTRTNVEWVAQVSLLSKLACRWQVEGGRNALLGSIPSLIAGCPISAWFWQMWDSTALALKPLAAPTTPYGCPMFAPAYVGRKRWAKPLNSLRRPGCSGQDPFARRNPGLKSETWATQSQSGRCSVIFDRAI